MPKRFRQALSPREPLAINPRALEIVFDVNTIKENEYVGRVAIVSVCGPLEHHESEIWDSYDCILQRLETAFECEDAAAVVMCIDSPGGDAAGATEAHRQIQRLKKKYKKPLYAYSNEAMYSAAYSVGSAADEIWVPETGGVGSIGVICALLDKTKQNKKLGLNIQLLTTGARKADSHADRELTEDVVNAMQERVDYLGDVFFKVVAKSRGMSPKDVEGLEADIFMGSQAVDAGLADGVAGWYKFLQYVSENIDSPAIEADNNGSTSNEESGMKTLAQLKKARDEAAKKLAGARSAAEHKTLLVAYEKSVQMLAKAEISAKTKYVKKTEETEETDDDEDEEEEEEEEEDEEEADDDDDDDDDDDADEEEEEEEEEDSKKSKKSKSKSKEKVSASTLSLKHVQRLYSLVQDITGCSDISEIFGSLEGMAPRVKAMPAVEQRLAKIEQSSVKTRVRSMLEKACVERRITKSQAKGLFEKGIEDPKWLKGYLAQQAPLFRSVEDGGLQPDIGNVSANLDTMSTDQKKMLRQAADSAGMSVEQYAEEIKKHAKPNGAVSPGKF